MLDRTPLPRYAQVADALRNRIRRGVLRQGKAIPTIDRLMAEFGVGRVTVRQAIQLLAREGLLSPEQGRGTFVTADPGSQRRLQVQTSLADLAEMYRGDAPDLEHIVETEDAPHFREGEGVAAPRYVHLRRVHSRDGHRYCLVSIYIARAVFDLAPARFRSELAIPLLLGLPGVEIGRARQSLDIAVADLDVARSLGIAVSAPIAEVRRLFVAPDETVVYVAEAAYRGDYIHLEMDLLKTRARNDRPDRPARHRPRGPPALARRRASAGRCAQRRARRPRRLRLLAARLLRRLDPRRRPSTGWPPTACATPTSTSTAMCSPTRACLLTGRNHHAVGHGLSRRLRHRLRQRPRRDQPARRRRSPRCCASAATAPTRSASGTSRRRRMQPGVGPFDHWPTQRGFDRYYGFLGGEDDQYAPRALVEDQHVSPLPDRPGYHLSEDLVDQARGFLADQVTTTPDRPFFLYLAFGACHAPHQAPPDFIEPYRGAFDAGLGRGARGTCSPGRRRWASCPPRPPCPDHNADVTPWEAVDEDARAVLCRMQEVFAGFTTHTDAQIGRLVDFLDRRGAAPRTRFWSSCPTTAPAARVASSARRTSTATSSACPTPSTRTRRRSTCSAARGPTTTIPRDGRRPATRR